MIRKIATGLMLSAFAGVLVIGCGKADLTQETAAWNQRAEEVNTKLGDVQKMHGELMQMHTAWQVADNADPAVKADYEKGGQMLSAHEAALGEVSKTIADQQEAMKAAVETGDKAKFEEAWKNASAAYDQASAKLDGIASEQAAMKAQADAMMAKDAKNGNDTAAAAAADAKPQGDAKAGDAKATDKKMDDKKSDAKASDKKATDKKDDKKGM